MVKRKYLIPCFLLLATSSGHIPKHTKCAGMETTGSGDSWGDKMNKSMLSNTLNKSKKEGKEEGREERRDRIPGSQKCLQT